MKKLTSPLLLITLLVSLISLLSSCKKYLGVKPRDYVTETELFSSQVGIQNALNGIYHSLGSSKLYGYSLTYGALDVMANYYNPLRQSSQYMRLQGLEIHSKTYLDTVTVIWKEAYTSILNVNNFIEQVRKAPSEIVSINDKDLLLGEGLAIRSFIHFDLLRLFGPVLATDRTASSIPYITQVKREASPLLAADQVMEHIIKDIDSALLLLQKDPVITNGTKRNSGFFSNRNLRMNYYAVKTLKARILLYNGDTEKAYQLATETIYEIEKHFPWTKNSNQAKENPLFEQECFFMVENKNNHELYVNFFSPATPNFNLNKSTTKFLDSTIYENNFSDFRYIAWFEVGTIVNKTDMYFAKYGNHKNTKSPFQGNVVPLIKKAELYLIASETSTTIQEKLDWVNILRLNRGNRSLTTQDIKDGPNNYIEREYYKEFWGEGQSYFYLKRTNSNTRMHFEGTLIESITSASYVAPLPLEELFR
jgi:hypothetical protein